jgi:hypothetical protein
LPLARLRAIVGGAPAFRRFTAALTIGYHPDGSAPEPGFLKAWRAGCFALRAARRLKLSTLRADRSFCRSTGAPEPPGTDRINPRAGTAPAPSSESALAKGALKQAGYRRRNHVGDARQGVVTFTVT